jgi:hypothetical protein
MTGCVLDALGGLYLAYDLLGGDQGPLRMLTRVATYSVLLILIYTLIFGVRFGLIAGLGMGTALGLQLGYYRFHARELDFKSILLLSFLRALAIGGAVAVNFQPLLGFVYALLAFTFFLVLYKIRLTPVIFYKIDKRPQFDKEKLKLVLVLSIGSTIGGVLAWLITGTPMIELQFALKLGLTVGLSVACAATFSPMIEYWADQLPERQMGVLGIVLFLIGFIIQATPYIFELFS